MGKQGRKSYSGMSQSCRSEYPSLILLMSVSGESKERASRLTNPHHDQEPRAEPPEIHNCTAGTLHEVIGIRAASADEVWQRCDDVGCDY